MITGINVRYIGPVPGVNLTRSQFNRLMKEAWEHTGRGWQEQFLDDHFEESAKRKYGYTPRAGEGKSGRAFWRSYTGRKQKEKGHTRPLVWSGESRSRAKSGAVTSTSRGAKVRIPTPALNFRNPHSKINMRDEITRVTDDEANQLAMRHASRIERALSRIGSSSKRL